MKKAHFAYLKKAVDIAVNVNGIADVASKIALLKSYRPPIYGLIRDIVSDPRFYSVTENTKFWHSYALVSVREFIDALPDATWRDSFLLNLAMEKFLVSWCSLNVMPMTAAREREIENELKRKSRGEPEDETDEEDEDGNPEWEECVKGDIRDFTDSPGILLGASQKNMPLEMQLYQHDALRGAGRGRNDPHRADAIYLSRLDSSLVDLAKMIGRHGGAVQTVTTGKFQHSRHSDISGVTVGDDLNALLPVELAMLGDKATQDVFFRRYTQKRLQVFSSNSSMEKSSRKKKGPIIMCIDTSGSMTGDPERMAKALALAVAVVAQRTCRPLCVINYSYDISFFVLLNMNRQRQDFLKFLSLSYSGGNNENLLFDFVFRELPQNKRYKSHVNQFAGADLLVISDFEWIPLSNDSLNMIALARAGGMKIYGLRVDIFNTYNHVDEKEGVFVDEVMIDGDRFFRKCDHRFLYCDGRVRELKK